MSKLLKLFFLMLAGVVVFRASLVLPMMFVDCAALEEEIASTFSDFLGKPVTLYSGNKKCYSPTSNKFSLQSVHFQYTNQERVSGKPSELVDKIDQIDFKLSASSLFKGKKRPTDVKLIRPNFEAGFLYAMLSKAAQSTLPGTITIENGSFHPTCSTCLHSQFMDRMRITEFNTVLDQSGFNTANVEGTFRADKKLFNFRLFEDRSGDFDVEFRHSLTIYNADFSIIADFRQENERQLLGNLKLLDKAQSGNAAENIQVFNSQFSFSENKIILSNVSLTAPYLQGKGSLIYSKDPNQLDLKLHVSEVDVLELQNSSLAKILMSSGGVNNIRRDDVYHTLLQLTQYKRNNEVNADVLINRIKFKDKVFDHFKFLLTHEASKVRLHEAALVANDKAQIRLTGASHSQHKFSHFNGQLSLSGASIKSFAESFFSDIALPAHIKDNDSFAVFSDVVLKPKIIHLKNYYFRQGREYSEGSFEYLFSQERPVIKSEVFARNIDLNRFLMYLTTHHPTVGLYNLSWLSSLKHDITLSFKGVDVNFGKASLDKFSYDASFSAPMLSIENLFVEAPWANNLRAMLTVNAAGVRPKLDIQLQADSFTYNDPMLLDCLTDLSAEYASDDLDEISSRLEFSDIPPELSSKKEHSISEFFQHAFSSNDITTNLDITKLLYLMPDRKDPYHFNEMRLLGTSANSVLSIDTFQTIMENYGYLNSRLVINLASTPRIDSTFALKNLEVNTLSNFLRLKPGTFSGNLSLEGKLITSGNDWDSLINELSASISYTSDKLIVHGLNVDGFLNAIDTIAEVIDAQRDDAIFNAKEALFESAEPIQTSFYNFSGAGTIQQGVLTITGASFLGEDFYGAVSSNVNLNTKGTNSLVRLSFAPTWNNSSPTSALVNIKGRYDNMINIVDTTELEQAFQMGLVQP